MYLYIYIYVYVCIWKLSSAADVKLIIILHAAKHTSDNTITPTKKLQVYECVIYCSVGCFKVHVFGNSERFLGTF